MRTARTVAELQGALAPHWAKGAKVGLVPTMGAFHDGHLSLMRAARGECDYVLVTIFVNPLQFQAGGDLSSYPRDLERDLALAQDCGVDAVFAPTVEELYPDGFTTTVKVTGLTEVLCGAAHRRGTEHFDGVTTVVAKLFNLIQPDRAYFGQKDAQQVRVIEQMVADLNFPVQLRVMPTVRENDGLAMSSRNAYLSNAERQAALTLVRSLELARQLIDDGATGAEDVCGEAASLFDDSGCRLEYLEIVDAETLESVQSLSGRVLVAVAAQVGDARLIDNIEVEVKPTRSTKVEKALAIH